MDRRTGARRRVGVGIASLCAAGVVGGCTFPDVGYAGDASATTPGDTGVADSTRPLDATDAPGSDTLSPPPTEASADSMTTAPETAADTAPPPAGCSTMDECPALQACDLTTHTCGPACGGNQTPCDMGCCSNGVCAMGTADDACGNDGLACADCAKACTPGPSCITGGVCGCNSTTGCPLSLCGTNLICNSGGMCR